MARAAYARKILLVLFVLHIALFLRALVGGTALALDVAFAALNLAAIGGLVTRTRAGWFVGMVFVAAAIARYSMTLGFEDFGGLLLIGVFAAAVLCITDPALRREHDIAV